MAFADSPQGSQAAEVPNLLGRAKARLHKAKGKESSGFVTGVADASSLLDAVASEFNLLRALYKVIQNKGAPGVDGPSVEAVNEHHQELLPRLRRELLAGTYRPGDIHRVWIPKPGGGESGLGIPNVVDRWVQQAVLQALEPIYEPTFHDGSHGFRRGRGAQTAIAKAREHTATGCGSFWHTPWESDRSIVLGDGRAVHRGKGTTGLRSPHRKHDADTTDYYRHANLTAGDSEQCQFAGKTSQ